MLKTRMSKAVAATVSAVLLVVGTTAATQAFTPNVVREVDHFIECFGWMITDPDTHAANCSPGKPPVYSPVSESQETPYIPPTTITTTRTTTTTTTTQPPFTTTGPV